MKKEKEWDKCGNAYMFINIYQHAYMVFIEVGVYVHFLFPSVIQQTCHLFSDYFSFLFVFMYIFVHYVTTSPPVLGGKAPLDAESTTKIMTQNHDNPSLKQIAKSMSFSYSCETNMPIDSLTQSSILVASKSMTWLTDSNST